MTKINGLVGDCLLDNKEAGEFAGQNNESRASVSHQNNHFNGIKDQSVYPQGQSVYFFWIL
jgi:hypothetical protein